eukprot:5985801-Alexandrium_andersonii.AAC.1
MKQLLLGAWHVGVPPILGVWNGGLHVFRQGVLFPVMFSLSLSEHCSLRVSRSVSSGSGRWGS